MQKTLKKIISIMLVVLMCMTAAPLDGFVGLDLGFTASAAEKTGTLSDDVTYTLTADGVLTIEGEGETEFDDPFVGGIGDDFNSPFYGDTDIKEVIISEGVTSICSYLFDDCSNLESITIPSSVTTIDSAAFRDCTSLKSIVIPDTVTIFGSYSVFQGCTALESATIGNGVDWISTDTFKDCTALKSVTIKSGTTEISTSAFDGCSNLNTVNFLGTEEQWSAIKNVATAIPSTATVNYLDGQLGDNVYYSFDESTGAVTITGSGDMYNYDDESNCSPFYWNDNVKSVAIDEGVTSVGNYVFWMCNDLAAVTLPTTLKTIGEEAFYSCGFTSVTIPENVETISNEAFLCCNSLTDVNIPKGVNTIGQAAFRSCDKLKAITVDESNEKYASIDGVLFNKDKTTLVYCPEGKTDESYTVPAGVTTIGTYAFHYAQNIKSITMTNDVTTLRDDAFDSCEKLESITLSNKITKIPQYAFWYCKALTSIDIPEGVTELGSRAFYNCEKLKTITLPSSLTGVGTSAFYGCSALTDVYYDGTEAQWNKIVIGSINTPLTNATKHYAYDIQLGDDVFAKLDEATGAVTITGTGDMYDYNTSDNKSPFNGNTDIKSVTIGEGVKTIGTNAFTDCTSLESIELPASANIKVGYNVAGLGTCTNLKSINVDEANANLASVDGVLFDKSMSTLILYPCAKADKSYTVPNGVAAIFASAFADNSNLENVTLGSNVWQIGSNAFNNCTALKSLTITSSVTNVADGAFNGCTALSDIYYCGTQDEWNTLGLASNSDVIANANVHFMLQLGDNVYYYLDETTGEVTITGTGDMYDYNDYDEEEQSPLYRNWNVKSVTIGEGVTSVGEYVFCDCIKLATVTFPTTLKKIGDHAFSSCGLTSVSIPENVETIYDYAFNDCSGLTNVDISSGAKSISAKAFFHCTALEGINVDTDNENYTSDNGVLFNKDMTTLVCYPAGRTYENYNVPVSVTTIASYAFYCAKNVKSITLTNAVTTLGNDAFAYCEKLENIALSSEIEIIPEYAFWSCKALTSIYIPEGVTEIGKGAFNSCAALETIRLPNSIKSVGIMAFSVCNGLTDVYYDGSQAQWNKITIGENNEPLTSATIHYTYIQLGENVSAKFDEATGELKVTGTGDMYNYDTFEEGTVSPLFENLDIKSITIDEGITSIGDGVFKSCQQAESVLLPSTIKSIGKHAFDECFKLNNVVIPAGCETIGEYAFNACFALSDLTITNGVKSIGDEAFGYCTALTNVTIPASVETIGKRPFNLCNKLQSITVDADNENYATVDGVLFNNDKTVLISYPQNKTDEAYTVPDSVKTIEELAFYANKNIKSVVLGENVETLGNSAFSSCSNLASVTISTKLTSISDNAFKNTALTDVYYGGSELQWNKITIGENNEPLTNATKHYAYIQLGDNVIAKFDETTGAVTITGTGDMYDYSEYDNRSPFYMNSNVKSVTIGEGVTSVGSNVFYGCDKLATVTLPTTLNKINMQAFYYNGLTSVTIPGNVETIGNNAFQYCMDLTTVTISNGVKTIGNSAFSDCSKLENITIPESVQSIGTAALHSCKAITVDENNENYASIDGVLFNKDKTTLIDYPTAKTDESYTVPAGVTTIVEDAFNKAKNIKSVTMTNDVTTLGAYAFMNCTKLESVTLSNKIEIIPDCAFYYCTALKSIVIPDGVTDIGNCAFYKCTALETVTLPNSLNFVNNMAFYECNNMTDVYYDGYEAQWKKVGIDDNNDPLTNATIHYAYNIQLGDDVFAKLDGATGELKIIGSGEMYNYEYNGSPLHDNTNVKSVTIGEGVTSVGSFVFDWCSNLATVTFPTTLTKINERAFRLCGLTSVTIPGNVETIGDSAFECCYSLATLTISNGVKTIGNSAFKYCFGLTSVTIPGSVETIGESAFEMCAGLTTLTISNGVKTIGDSAFVVCSVLTSLTIPGSVETIDGYAFCGCSSLTTVTISDGVKTIGDYAFSDCNALTSITVDENNENYASVDGVLFNKDKTTLICYPAGKTDESYLVPAGVTTISAKAFMDATKLTSIVIPEGVTEIAEGTFYNCKALKTVTLPHSLKSVGDLAFAYYYINTSSFESYMTTLNVETVYYNACAGQKSDFDAITFGENNECIEDADVICIADHDFGDVQYKAAGCLAPGYEYKSCKICGLYFAKDADVNSTDGQMSSSPFNIPIKGHTFIEIPENPATCTSDGNKAYKYCSACRTYFKSTASIYESKGSISPYSYFTDKLGHTFTTVHATSQEPDCCNDGWNAYKKCSTCNKFFSIDVTDKYSTDGLESDDSFIHEALGHNFGDVQHSDLSCLEDGYDYKQCSTCSLYFAADADVKATGGVDTYEGFITPATGHDFDDVVNTAEATCTADGVSAAYKQCKNCKKYFDENAGITAANGADTNKAYIIKATGHIFHTQEAQDPDCTTGGWYTFQVCDICEELFEADADKFSTDNKAAADFKRDALGHTFTDVPYKAATCLEDGNEAYKYCSVCNKYFDATADDKATNGADTNEAYIIAATGHNFNDTVTGYAPDCCNDGIDSYKTCSNCYKYFAANAEKFSTDSEESDTAFVRTATGHNFGDIVEIKPATCTEDGVKIAYKYCDKCGLYYDASARDTEIFGQGTENPSRFIENAHGHNFTDVPFTAAKCTEPGNEAHKYCSACEKYFDATAEKFDTNGADDNSAYIITATGHEFTGTIKMDTDGKDGKHSFACANGCGEYSNAVAHVWDAGTITTPATHLEEGVKTFTCACGATYTEPVAKLEGHTYTTNVVEPTCTEQGYVEHTCACGDSYKDSYVDALGHSYKNGVCSSCGESDPNYTGSETEHCDCICHSNTIYAKILRLLYTILSIIRFGRTTCCPDMEYLIDIGDIS